MEHFETEEQQVEALKRFWHEYGKSIVGGAILGLGGLWGWNYYQQDQMQAQEVASSAFEQVLAKAENGDELTQAVEAFRAEHGSTGYSAMSDLLQARVAVDAGELDKAAPLLERAIADLDDTVKPLAQMRLARVQHALQNVDAALATVEAINNSAYEAQREELKGDLLVAKGDITAARTAYQAALAAGGTMSNPALQMKIDELAQAS
ncbi:YfgM family protein [Ferrimonas lipolytica]|uniref:Ancillary SecYEG translocon subunit n=1 Tax=Ferrimonas lipolytica TaxID=2724191 RepID=A0A6H1UD25_9GAMM|nr:tetratricopeptide repeat protein [Ferrimonas lipolytica]QIZ76985.1 tetratricopeptide repeat protein [Ferrimonas lipolytica]